MNPNSRFVVAYVCLAVFFGSVAASAAICTLTWAQPAPVAPAKCAAITNKTYPNDVECHFKGKPLHHFPANLIPGMPTDGYCEDYSNKVSWRIFKCMGTQPESQP